jgi:hypothetical protein
MDNNNNNKQENLTQIITLEDQAQYNSKGIYVRDDHCDWGSSGMNEFTNEYSEKNNPL